MSVFKDVYVYGLLEAASNVTVAGNLTVSGTTTSVDSQNVLIADNHLFLNSEYKTNTAQEGGIVVNYLPTATTTTGFTGGVASTTQLKVTSETGFATADLILVTGAANVANNGLYEIDTTAANTINIKASPVYAFIQNALVTDAADTGYSVTKVNIALLQATTGGAWQVSKGATSTAITSGLKTILLSGDSVSNTSITLTDETNQINLGTSGVITLSGVSTNNRTYTMTDAGANADFIMTEGAQTLNGPKTLAAPITTGQVSSALGSAATPTLTFTGDTNTGIYSSGADNVDIATAGTQRVNVGSTGTVSVFSTSNQVILGSTNTTTISATAPSASRTYTLTDVGGAADFVMTAGAQTLSGQKTLADPITTGQVRSALGSASAPTLTFTGDLDTGIYSSGANSVDIATNGGQRVNVDSAGVVSVLATTNQLKLGTTNTTTISATAPAASRTYTVPDAGGAADFVLTVGAQTLASKTLTAPVTTGQILSADGTAGAPTYSFSSDTDTGLYGGVGVAALAVGGTAIITAGATNTTVSNNLKFANEQPEVKAYTGAGAHVLATDGKRINTVNHTSAAAVTLPASSGSTDGTTYTIIRTGTGAVTINRSSSDTIDDASSTSLVLNKIYQRVTLALVGTIWYIV